MLKKINYITKKLFFSDNYSILRFFFNLTASIVLGLVTSYFLNFGLKAHVPYGDYLETLLFGVLYYCTILFISNINTIKKYYKQIIIITLVGIMLPVTVGIFIICYLFSSAYVLGYAGLISTYIDNVPKHLRYNSRDNSELIKQRIEMLKSIGIDDGFNMSCVGPINFDTVLYAFTPPHWQVNHINLFIYNYYRDVSSCFERGFLFLALLILTLVFISVLIYSVVIDGHTCVKSCGTCVKSCKKEVKDLTEEIQVIDVKINN